MPGPLKNPKHEAFVQAVFKGMAGGPAYKACLNPGMSNDVSNSAASRLLGYVKVRARLDELQARVAEKAVITRASLIQGVHEVTEDAKAKGVHAAALRGYELLGREFKTFTERKDVTVRSIGDLAEEEIKNALSELDAADEGEAEAGASGGVGKKGAAKKRRG